MGQKKLGCSLKFRHSRRQSPVGGGRSDGLREGAPRTCCAASPGKACPQGEGRAVFPHGARGKDRTAPFRAFYADHV